MNRDIFDAVDEAGTIRICLEAVADLMNADEDAIQRAQRGNLCLLMGYLNDRLQVAHNKIWEAAKVLQNTGATTIGEVPHVG